MKLGTFVKFIQSQDSLEKKLFWIVIIICMVVAVYSTAVTFTEHVSVFSCFATSLSCVIFLSIMSIAHVTKQYSNCYMAMCLALNCFLLPVNFFVSGGVMSGMSMYFATGTFLCAFCLQKRNIIISVTLSAIAIIFTYLVALTKVSFVQEVTMEYAYLDSLAAYVIVASAVVAISLFVQREVRNQRFKEINNGIIDILSTMVEFRSVEAGDHVERIKGFTRILLSYVNQVYDNVHLSASDIAVISSAAAMHDIGKIAIPDGILLKGGPLTKTERLVMQRHTIKGCEIIRSMRNIQDQDYYRYGYEICRYHHERYDGKGYPDGLKGEQIPLCAQVVALADVYDALVNERCYKQAYSFEQSYDMIMNGECGVFSPKLLKCLEMAKKDMEIYHLAMKQRCIVVEEEPIGISDKIDDMR